MLCSDKWTATNIKHKIINEEKVFYPRDIQEALGRVLGKRLAFRLKVVPGNTCHSVSQLSQDEALFSSTLAKLPSFDLQDEVELSISSVHENNDAIDSQCFSDIVEFNPHLPGSIIAAKHNLSLSHTQLDGISFEDLSSIQLSSARVTKHIKTK
ncbi:hypothetical protein JHK82_019046 [Glycine max]|nr:hypothetical protein JHK85_019488 [Glycine max]KAG5038228.1 hypothetical protein JHK86_019068 [Glycine max]KAG5143351.1 hypothetical protein JHK82_019046 [Glycine max]